MEALEKKLRYSFTDRGLITTALTHSSYANEHRCQSNERLEYLGDSVLGMVVADRLYAAFPQLPEGRLTRIRAELVCEESLWPVADDLGLGAYLRLGKGEAASGGRERHSILADCVEAVIAAIYLDGGLDAARRFIDERILVKLEGGTDAIVRDYKTELQELVQQTPGQSVSYAVVEESGPDHMKCFTVSAMNMGREIGRGQGRTKKEAEQNAARAALEGMER